MPRERIRILALVFALITSLYLDRILPGLIAPIDYALSDWRSKVAISWTAFIVEKKGLDSKERRLVIIDIDEKSVAQEGAWPWPRDKVGTLLKTLIDDYKISGAALDIVFPEIRQNDELLAKQIQRPEITGAVVYDLLNRELPEVKQDLPLPITLKIAAGAPRTIGLPTTGNHSAIMPERIGHITPIHDDDGAIRHLPPFICSPTSFSRCMPLLEVAAFAGLLDRPTFKVQAGTGWFSPAWEMLIMDGDNMAIATIPLTKQGLITVPYRHVVDNWMSFSATDILQRKIDPIHLRGSVVLVGSTALGMADVIATPISSGTAGLAPHAEVLSALFDNYFPYQPRDATLIVAMILLPLALLLHWAIRTVISPIAVTVLYPGWLVISLALGFLVALACYIFFSLLIPLTPILFFPPLAILICTLLALHKSSIEQVGVLGLLSAYLPKQVAQRLSLPAISGKKIDTNIDASRREITVLFADIRGFTGLVETQSPEVVATLMHKIFSEMSHAVVNHHGTIDKFIGDAVMAFWNAPEDDEFHAQHAFEAAQEMLQRINGLADFCCTLKLAPVSVSIGLETGLALVGHFGSEHRRTYTALGETVVLASRIEGLATQFKQHILIGDACAQHLSADSIHYLGQTSIRGRQKMIEVYAPVQSNLE
ncbi:CHASE2 domain-containing protein [Undibacterium amnicola]|uniref:CHASE2 domain-containing protein n=1 Tax=Undibacterium amnicola TaxID=1834038 RepID=A0ABR6XRX3_9BURK|nr:adenylate/guanylate cyclase domain-containing protein [Undibacterium amnicola]MBC3832229.1 CHASE2 domain-containing protein [Undibacterium amnicola]